MSSKDIVEMVASVVAMLATILAGAFAYYRFVKGRVFHARLTVTAHAHQLRLPTTTYVVTAVEVSNGGLSRIDITDATLRLSSAVPRGTAGPGPPERRWLDTMRVLLAHSWIESGETLREQHLLTLPPDHDAPVLVDFRVVAQKVSFTATAVAEPVQGEGGQHAERA